MLGFEVRISNSRFKESKRPVLPGAMGFVRVVLQRQKSERTSCNAGLGLVYIPAPWAVVIR